MKSLLIVASLALGTAAMAQDMPAGSAPMQGSPPNTNTPAPATPDASSPAPGATDTTQPSQSSAPSDSSMPMSPPAGSSAAPMTPPAGDPGMSSASGGTPTDTSNYPTCSRGVTDKCVQGSHAGHATAHHRRRR